MSQLSIGTDDFPLAAGKHLGDAQALAVAARPDGCAYLSGYVVECCLKSLWLLQTGVPARLPPKWSSSGHALKELHEWVTTMSSVAGSRVARYLGPAFAALPTSPMIASWEPGLRYQAQGTVTPSQAEQWLADATSLFDEVVGEMHLDGEV